MNATIDSMKNAISPANNAFCGTQSMSISLSIMQLID
jgi:hypothetical protein